MGFVRQVWFYNMSEELALLNRCLIDYPVVVFDTEFPGFLRCTPRGAPEEDFYEDLKFNVNRLKLLQLGLTVVDNSGIVGMTWEFNFSDFDETIDPQSSASIQFLKKNGFDFKKNRKEGISFAAFHKAFLPICCSDRIANWVTFHGFYDVAYLLKLMAITTMPESIAVFAAEAQRVFGTVSDVKYMIRNYDHLLNGKLGLQKLAELLNVERNGVAHHAGSDSRLTAYVYSKMRNTIFKSSSEDFDGFLYGLQYRIMKPYKIQPPVRKTNNLSWWKTINPNSRSPLRLLNKFYSLPVSVNVR